MKMMSKLSLVALAMCAASTAVHAEDKSYGTASAKVTVNAMQEWKIEKVSDGVINLKTDGKFKNYGANTAFKVTNSTATASKYYITGSGASAGTDGVIYSVNDGDATKKFQVGPVNSNGDGFTLDTATKKYQSISEVANGASDEFKLNVTTNATVLTPGSYTTTVELFVPSV